MHTNVFRVTEYDGIVRYIEFLESLLIGRFEYPF